MGILIFLFFVCLVFVEELWGIFLDLVCNWGLDSCVLVNFDSWQILGSGMNLVTTIIGFGMSATFIVFVCTRIICGRLRASASRQMFEIESRNIDLEQVYFVLRHLCM